tara:strand:- start:713 stop:1114 length:402 start_codon:yes stop_codon:yes gene_type:complete
MADAVSVSTIQDGGRTAIFYLTNTSDGTGEDAVTKIDVSALATSADGDTCTGVRIQNIVFTTVGMGVKLLFDATTDVIVAELPPNYSDTLDYSAIGGLPNYAGTGKTGDIKLTTVGAADGETYAITITCTKEY